jgi:hypothetical protein
MVAVLDRVSRFSGIPAHRESIPILLVRAALPYLIVVLVFWYLFYLILQ